MLLRELQQNFVQEVFENHETCITDCISENGIEPTRRLQIYSNNIRTTLAEALQDIYPATCALVGEEYFKFMANKYRTAYPPASGDISNYGKHLSEFILNIEQLSNLKYLPDIAKMDWCYHRAMRALAKPALQIDELAKIPSELHEKVVLQLHPSTHLVSSQYPIYEIWKFALNFDDISEPPNVAGPGQHVMIVRQNNQTVAILLDDDLHLFVDLIDKEITLGEAVTQLFSFNPSYNLELRLSEIFETMSISGLTVSNN